MSVAAPPVTACRECGADTGGLYVFCLPCAFRRPPDEWLEGKGLTGATEPRLWTRPLRPLTPETSLGYQCVAFSVIVLGVRLDPWQVWFLIHALEVNPDGSYRFRTILLLVSRQNGKTTVMRVLTLWAMFTGRVQLVVGTAQDLDVARECWLSAVDLVEEDPTLSRRIAGRKRRAQRANGKEELKLRNKSRYKIKATTEDAGRGIPGVGLLLADELRTHRDYKAWGALSKTTMAIPNALIIGMSNAGSDASVVLNGQRANALGAAAALDELIERAQADGGQAWDVALAELIETADLDTSAGVFEWSALEGCTIDDRSAWIQANPSLGYGRLTERALISAMSDPAEVFRTECLCQRVMALDGAIDGEAWKAGKDGSATIGPGWTETPEEFRVRRGNARIVACFDAAPDGTHATLALAVVESGKVRVEIAASWRDTAAARAELPDMLAKIDPHRLVWFPSGPSAALAPLFGDRKLLPSRRAKVEGLKGEQVTAACMGFADLVAALRVLHPGDELLDAHVGGAEKLRSVDGWRFMRRGVGNCDAAYAAAGAAHVALSLPASRGEEWRDVVV